MEGINFLSMVQFYCMKEKMKLEKLFNSVFRRVSRSYRTYSMVTGSRHPLSRRFPSSLVFPVVTGTFPFARKIERTSSLNT